MPVSWMRCGPRDPSPSSRPTTPRSANTASRVAAGEALTAESLTDGQELTTLQGQTLKVTKSGDQVLINGIPVIAADVPATNGVIHVIGGVLVPES